MTRPCCFGVRGPISELFPAARALVMHRQDTVATRGALALFDLDAAKIGAIAMPDAKSGLIRLVCTPVGRFQVC